MTEQERCRYQRRYGLKERQQGRVKSNHHARLLYQRSSWIEDVLAFVDIHKGWDIAVVWQPNGQRAGLAGFALGQVLEHFQRLGIIIYKFESNAAADR
jgi:hypothetical protein